MEIPMMTPRAPGTISFEQLKHHVPLKAAKEMDKADRAREHRNLDDAILHLNRTIQIDPEFMAARNNLAALYLITSRPGLAIEQLEAAIKLDPHTSMPYSNLAVGYVMLSRFGLAERAARQAIDLDRAAKRPHMILGLVMVMQDKLTPEALTSLRLAETEYPHAHLLAARVLAGQGENEKAISEIHDYLATNDESGREMAKEWLTLLDGAQQRAMATTLH